VESRTSCGTVLHNAFSPNGDGVNEMFTIDNIDDTICYPENTVEIYNRWGVLVLKLQDIIMLRMLLMVSLVEELLLVNHQVPTGTYFYILNYTSVDGTGQIQTNKQDGYLYQQNNENSTLGFYALRFNYKFMDIPNFRITKYLL
jgi:hypothetical protein